MLPVVVIDRGVSKPVPHSGARPGLGEGEFGGGGASTLISEVRNGSLATSAPARLESGELQGKQ